MDPHTTRPDPASPQQAVDDAVRGFVTAGDHRDLGAMERLLHGDFRVAFHVRGSDEVKTLDRAAYLALLGAGKLGGSARRAAITQATVDGALARVTAVLEGPGGRFDSAYLLARQAGQWRLLEDATVFAPAG